MTAKPAIFRRMMRDEFQAQFGELPTIVVQSPGRINLIGEHTDYNAGFVFPAAIDKHMTIAIGFAPASTCTIIASDLGETISIDLHDSAWQPQQSWARYVWGMLHGLCLIGTGQRGFQAIFGGNIPLGAGLSSSAALCTGWGLALNELYDLGLGRPAIAKIAQYAEREFAGVNCGLMDQYASLLGRAGHFLKLDCRNLSYEYVPADLGEYQLLLCDSRVKHALADSAYNRRREECAEGVAALATQFPFCMSLRDANLEMLKAIEGQVSATVMRRCKYVIEENARVAQVAHALQAGDLAQVGAAMFATHRGLQHDYEVSCAELDFLVDLAATQPDIAGARLMGGGFGGCTLNLIQSRAIVDFEQLAAERFAAAFGIQPLFYPVHIGDGGLVTR